MRTLAADIVGKTGEEVELSGWVSARRDHGKLIFIDVRDRSGTAQVVFNSDVSGAKELRSEYVVMVRGTVKERPEAMINEAIPTGRHEVSAASLEILSRAAELPIPVDGDGYEISEEARLRYRYLDMRRERMQRNMRVRSKFVDRIRQFLFGNDFTEIETPVLTKSTPEGARDFIVPSRLHPGKFFALPQSPQQYKQLLMVGGFERYFQIARCLRDEDIRADRGFEHTQIDIEMSFVEREDVMALDEQMISSVMKELGYTLKEEPFPVFTYQEAMKRFGADKFDLRTSEEKEQGVLAFAWVVDFPFFEKTDAGGWTFTHNPFSMPRKEYVESLKKGENVGSILTSQYDLVCNGYEVGGGSIRAHDSELLVATFRVMGYDDETVEKQFGHMLEAFRYGAPPHGGIAHGVDRLVMTLTGEEYIREVQAFPQTGSGRTSVMDAPSEVGKDQLSQLGIEIKER